MLKHFYPMICLSASIFAGSFAVSQEGPVLPHVFEVNAATLAHLKATKDKRFTMAAISEAEKAMKAQPHSVMEKRQTPPSGDKHDWYSQAGYWWKDPKNPKGAYVRHDGVRNPEKEDFTDEKYFNETVKNANTLGLAYYLTGNERYAAHATALLVTWFLAPATAMKPNLTYAQFIKGKNDGRPSGIVSARNMPEAVDAVGYIAGSKSWTSANDAAMQRWFSEYYKWLTTSDAGKEESSHPNNHGSWFQVQAAAIALYLGKTEDAIKIAKRVRDQRIPDQIDSKGMQKYEMIRTKSFSYSAMNLHALTAMAEIAAPLGIDLYKGKKPNSPTILTAIDALLPFDPRHPWPHEQIEKNREDSICPALYYAVGYTHDPKYVDGVKRFDCTTTATYGIISLGSTETQQTTDSKGIQ